MNNTEVMELLPCPFCGASASVNQVDSAAGEGRMIWVVGCVNEKCEVTFHGHARKVDAIRAWNTRQARSEYQAATANNGGLHEACNQLIAMDDDWKLAAENACPFDIKLYDKAIGAVREALSAPPTAEGKWIAENTNDR